MSGHVYFCEQACSVLGFYERISIVTSDGISEILSYLQKQKFETNLKLFERLWRKYASRNMYSDTVEIVALY